MNNDLQQDSQQNSQQNSQQVSQPPAQVAPTIQSPISQAQAVDTTHRQNEAELEEFAAVLGLPATFSIDKLATLLEHLVMQQTSADSQMIRDQMVRDGWEKTLGSETSIDALAERATTFLSSEHGIALFNFFVKTFARTSSKMLADEVSDATSDS